MFKKLSRFLYTAARKTNDLSALTSGDPVRIVQRFINKQIGKNVYSKINLGKNRGRKK